MHTLLPVRQTRECAKLREYRADCHHYCTYVSTVDARWDQGARALPDMRIARWNRSERRSGHLNIEWVMMGNVYTIKNRLENLLLILSKWFTTVTTDSVEVSHFLSIFFHIVLTEPEILI